MKKLCFALALILLCVSSTAFAVSGALSGPARMFTGPNTYHDYGQIGNQLQSGTPVEVIGVVTGDRGDVWYHVFVTWSDGEIIGGFIEAANVSVYGDLGGVVEERFRGTSCFTVDDDVEVLSAPYPNSPALDYISRGTIVDWCGFYGGYAIVDVYFENGMGRGFVPQDSVMDERQYEWEFEHGQ